MMKKIALKGVILIKYNLGKIEKQKVPPASEVVVEACLATQEAAVIQAIREAATIHTLDLAAAQSVEV